MMLILSFTQIHPVNAYSTEQFQFYLRDELTGGSIPSGVNVTAYYKGGSYITFFVPEAGLLWNASYDVLYFSFDLGSGVYRQYWLLDGETTGIIMIYGGTYTYGISGSPYTLQFYDLAGVLADYPFVEVISSPNAVDEYSGIIERRKLDADRKIHSWSLYGNLYNIKILSNTTSYTYGDLLFSNLATIPLTVKGLDFPQTVILAYKYNRIYAERYNNYSTIKVSYEDTLGDLANVTISIKFDNATEAASTSYDNTASFVYTWLLAEYNESYYVQTVITHSLYGIMNYNAHLYHGGYNVSPWNFPLGSLNSNISTADIIPNIIIFGCFLIFSKANAFVAPFFATAVTIILCLLGWSSIPATAIMAALVFTIMLGIAYAKRRVFY
jgi:hypothetical protein